MALLLASFGSNVLIEKEEDEDKIGEAIDRIKRFFRSLLQIKQNKKTTAIKDNTTGTMSNDQVCLFVYYYI